MPSPFANKRSKLQDATIDLEEQRKFYDAVSKSNANQLFRCLANADKDQQRTLLTADNCLAFRLANGHSDLFQTLHAIANLLGITDEIKSGIHHGFMHAAENTNVKTLQELWSCAQSFGIDSQILTDAGLTVFPQAIAKGHLKVVRNLLGFAASLGTELEMLKGYDEYNLSPFEKAAENGHLDIVRELWACAISLGIERDMLKCSDYGAFTQAAKNGYLNIVQELWAYALSLNVEQKMLQAEGYQAFMSAANLGEHVVVLELFEYAESLGLKKNMIAANNYAAFKAAIVTENTNGRQIVNAILTSASAQQRSIMLAMVGDHHLEMMLERFCYHELLEIIAHASREQVSYILEFQEYRLFNATCSKLLFPALLAYVLCLQNSRFFLQSLYLQVLQRFRKCYIAPL